MNMTDNFRRVVDEVVALDVQPAAAFLNGDCAFHLGLKDDYHHVAQLLDPLRKAGMPLHLGMGNHDDRAQFRRRRIELSARGAASRRALCRCYRFRASQLVSARLAEENQ